ncbi:MAG: 2-hydroxyacid dehydrogenase [Coleofasciculaceae cyanobacterium SM2_1_6]|nr:2-hydroxyacid dehydrogenase [Coleofasciculaceae cyanobacterium SM2_1_6]
MKVAVFSTKPYDRQFLETANDAVQDCCHQLSFFEARLDVATAPLAAGFPVVCVFVNDNLDAPTLKILAEQGTRLIALRCTGFNNVDRQAVRDLGLKVVRVTAYSPYSVAEFALGMILSLNRKIHRAYNRTREGNFALDGLLGFDLHGRTIGVIGTGKIGLIFANLMTAFGCQVLGYDPYPNPEFTKNPLCRYVPLAELFAQADVISLHCPLSPETRYIINAQAIEKMKPGVILINTSRGALIDTGAVIVGLKSQTIGALGLDVYEQEAELFFEDLSNEIIQDDTFERLLTFPNVLVTGHQAFFTEDALGDIAATTIANITNFATNQPLTNQVS